MSNDKICLLKAVADLPEQHAGFVLDIVNLLRLGDTASVRFEIGQAIASLSKRHSPTKIAKAVAACLLVLVGTISVAATTEKFVAKDNFVVNTEADAKVKISRLNKNFKTWFIDKVEEPFQGVELRYLNLAEDSVDGPIITGLGGRAKAETTLTEMFSVMSLQGRGEEGALVTNEYSNIFYIRDQNGVLRTVYIGWNGDGWDVEANSVKYPYMWRAGHHQVFSRSSLAA